MAGFKRGGARGGSNFKKTFTKKRSSPDADADDDNAPRVSKKTKAGDDNDDDSVPLVPELKTDDNGDAYVGVSCTRRNKETKRRGEY